jgi:hypothetical protein
MWVISESLATSAKSVLFAFTKNRINFAQKCPICSAKTTAKIKAQQVGRSSGFCTNSDMTGVQ